MSFRGNLSNFQSTLERKTGFRQIRRLISHAKCKRNYINASSTSVSAVEKTVRAEKCRKKSGAQKRSGEERDGWALPSFRRRLPVSNIGIGRRRRRGRGLGDACGKFKTYKTYKQTNFFPRRSYRHAAIVSRITRCQMPIIFTRRWQLRHAALAERPGPEGGEAVYIGCQGTKKCMYFIFVERELVKCRRTYALYLLYINK